MGALMAITAAVFTGMAFQAAANVVTAAPGGEAFTLLGLGLGDWPAWISLLIPLAGLATTIISYQTLVVIRNRTPEIEKTEPNEFVRMLCRQIGECTDRMTTVFAQRLRQPPGDIAAMRILVRHLREDLSIPMNFITQMRAHPPGDWRGIEVFRAFTNWSAQVVAMAKQLDDLHEAITFPLLREPVDKHRDAMLVHQYLIEQAFLDRRIDDIAGRANEFCTAASKVLKKDKKKTSDNDPDEADSHCPCCRHPTERHWHRASDPLQPIVLPAPPDPPAPVKAAPAPTPTPCRCAPPRACQCYRNCCCACQCAPLATKAAV